MKASVAAWESLSKAEKQLCRVKAKIGEGYVKKSKRDVTMLLVRDYFSVVYFCKTRSFRVYVKFGQDSKSNGHINLKTINEVSDYLTKSLVEFDGVS